MRFETERSNAFGIALGQVHGLAALRDNLQEFLRGFPMRAGQMFYMLRAR